MIVISNRQRDELVKFLDLLCERLNGKTTKEYNTKRLALKLSRTLSKKQPLAAEDMRELKKICRPVK
ncbi:MAG: hypothetical protein IKU22_08920 [Alistipes sp.]|nr:hypothetical protein [Alistipes sp.]